MKHNDLIAIANKKINNLKKLSIKFNHDESLINNPEEASLRETLDDMISKIISIRDICEFGFLLYKGNPNDLNKGMALSIHQCLMKLVMNEMQPIEELDSDYPELTLSNYSATINSGTSDRYLNMSEYAQTVSTNNTNTVNSNYEDNEYSKGCCDEF